MPLSDEELRAVLTRAAEIQQAAGPDGAEFERMIGRAEAAGYSRAAVERALRERFGTVARPGVGELTFARSSDGKYHVARVVSDSAIGARVKFLLGSEGDVALDQIRPFSLTPGERVWVNWPMWGAWLCEVISYDEENGYVKLSDRWGSSHTCPIAELWVQPPAADGDTNLASFVKHAAMIGGSMALGAVIGSVITALLLR